jgi:hypothetical protein
LKGDFPCGHRTSPAWQRGRGARLGRHPHHHRLGAASGGGGAVRLPEVLLGGYKQANFKVLAFKFKDCYLQEIPDGLNGGGSWYNNQSAGTKARMYGGVAPTPAGAGA